MPPAPPPPPPGQVTKSTKLFCREKGCPCGLKGSVIPTGAATCPGCGHPISQHKKFARVATREAYKFDFQAMPADINADLAWETAEGARMSGEGSQGVVFVFIPDKGAVVVKASRELAEEIFSTSVARLCSIPGPKIRAVLSSSEEGQLIKATLGRLEPACKSKIGSAKCLLVMEYLKGYTLSGVDPEKFRGYMENEAHRNLILRQLGALAGMDLLLNNSDRVPLHALNHGNAGNVMFQQGDGQVISLDNGIMSLRGDALRQYCDSVGGLVRKVFNHQLVDGSEKIRAIIKEYTHYDIGTAGRIELQLGVRQFVVESSKLSVPRLMQIKLDLEDTDSDMGGLDNIDEMYLEVMLLLMRTHGAVNTEQLLAIAQEAVDTRRLHADEINARDKEWTAHSDSTHARLNELMSEKAKLQAEVADLRRQLGAAERPAPPQPPAAPAQPGKKTKKKRSAAGGGGSSPPPLSIVPPPSGVTPAAALRARPRWASPFVSPRRAKRSLDAGVNKIMRSNVTPYVYAKVSAYQNLLARYNQRTKEEEHLLLKKRRGSVLSQWPTVDPGVAKTKRTVAKVDARNTVYHEREELGQFKAATTGTAKPNRHVAYNSLKDAYREISGKPAPHLTSPIPTTNKRIKRAPQAAAAEAEQAKSKSVAPPPAAAANKAGSERAPPQENEVVWV